MSDGNKESFWFGVTAGIVFTSVLFLVLGTAMYRLDRNILLDQVATGQTVEHDFYFAQYSAVRRMSK